MAVFCKSTLVVNPNNPSQNIDAEMNQIMGQMFGNALMTSWTIEGVIGPAVLAIAEVGPAIETCKVGVTTIVTTIQTEKFAWTAAALLKLQMLLNGLQTGPMPASGGQMWQKVVAEWQLIQQTISQFIEKP